MSSNYTSKQEINNKNDLLKLFEIRNKKNHTHEEITLEKGYEIEDNLLQKIESSPKTKSNKKEIKLSKEINLLKSLPQNTTPTTLEMAVLYFVHKISQKSFQGIFAVSQLSRFCKIKQSNLYKLLENIRSKKLAILEDSSKGKLGFVKYKLTNSGLEYLKSPVFERRIKLFMESRKNKNVLSVENLSL